MTAFEILLDVVKRACERDDPNATPEEIVALATSFENVYHAGGLCLEDIEAAALRSDAIVFLQQCAINQIQLHDEKYGPPSDDPVDEGDDLRE